MKHIAFFALAILLTLIPWEVRAMNSGANIAPDDIAEFTDTFFHEQMESFQVPGAAVVIVRGDQILYSQGYGFADLEAEIPVSVEETVFRAGSVSKLFTATAIMQLYERGQIDLNTDINTYLTGFKVQSREGSPVTSAQLLTHTAGFEENYIGMHVRSSEDLIPMGEFLAEHLPAITNEPGSVISYNDHGMTLAGYLVEEITGMLFEDYVTENILKPLDMTSSTFNQPPDRQLLERVAVGYRYKNEEYHPYLFDYLNVAPAAALVGSADDMAHFIIAHLNGGVYHGQQILTSETVALMQSQQFSHHPQLRGRAYGFSEWVENGQRGLFHDGGNPGFMSRLLILPKHNLGFYIAINGDQQSKASGLRYAFTSQFLDAFFPEPETQTVEVSPPADFIARADHYTGYYRELPGYSSATITKLASLLSQVPISKGPDNTLKIGSGTAVEVEPLVFRWQGSNNYAVFRENQKGEVAYYFSGTGAYQKLAWYETQPFHIGLAILFVSGFLGMLGMGAFAKPLGGATRLVMGSIGLINLAFLIGIGTALMEMDQWNIFYGLPLTLKLLLVLPILTTLLTVGLVVLTGAAWTAGESSMGIRALAAALTLIAVGFIPFLNYWNLLGFKQ
jgi:CubicO group peptidase (beta-lactamase class C family)